MVAAAVNLSMEFFVEWCCVSMNWNWIEIVRFIADYLTKAIIMQLRKLTHDELLAERLTQAEAQSVVRHPVTLLLHNIRSLYNVGSIFRTADAGLAQNLLLAGYTPTPPRKEITKTALGADQTVPWQYFSTTQQAIEYLRRQKPEITIVAVELAERSRSVYELSADDFPLCLVLGNEITGIDDTILALCDAAVEIPMYGVKHSLNVSVATGIALFEAVRVWTMRKQQ